MLDGDGEEGAGAEIHSQVSDMLDHLEGDDSDDSGDEGGGTDSDEDPDDAEGEEAGKVETDDDGIPTDAAELRKGYLRTADYTRKTQKLAEKRKELDKQLAELEAIKAQYQQGPARKVEPEGRKDEAEPPANATAEQLLKWYVQQEVKVARAELESTLAPLRPAAEMGRTTQGVVAAYSEIVGEDGTDPVFATKSAAELVGTIIEGDEDLMDLARTNPKRAVRLAMKEAKASLANARATKKNQDARGASPLSTPQGRRAAPTAPTALEAAAAALKEWRAGGKSA